eukprot:UN13028
MKIARKILILKMLFQTGAPCKNCKIFTLFFSRHFWLPLQFWLSFEISSLLPSNY